MALRLKISAQQKTNTVSSLEKYVDSPRIPKIPEETEEELLNDSTSATSVQDVEIDYTKTLLEDIIFSETQSLQFVHDLETKKPLAIGFITLREQIMKIIDFITGQSEKYLKINITDESKGTKFLSIPSNDITNYETNPANDPTHGFHAGYSPASREVFLLTYRKAGLSQFASWALTNIEALSDTVIESEEYLDHLFDCLFLTNSFLDEVPTQGKEWAKVIEYFMCKHTKCPKLVSYFTHSRTGHSQKNIFHGLLNKISNEYVYKLFLEVLASDDSLINWDELLSKEPHNIVDLIAAKLREITSISPTHYNYSRQLELFNLVELMKAIIKQGQQRHCSTLLQTKEFLLPILSLVFHEPPHFTSLPLLEFINCVLRVSINSGSYDSINYPAIISIFLDGSSHTPFLTVLKKLIIIEPQSYNLSDAILQFPAGQFRLALIECVNCLFLSNFSAVHKKLMQEKLLTTLFDLFFKHKRNNILHSAIQRLFFDFVYCEDSSLLSSFVVEYNLLDKLVNEFSDYLEKLQKGENPNTKPTQNTRYEKVIIEERHYLGHVFLIADKIRRVAALIPDLYQLIDNHLRWKELTDGIWSEMQELQKRKMY